MGGFWIWADNVNVIEFYIPYLVQLFFYFLCVFTVFVAFIIITNLRAKRAVDRIEAEVKPKNKRGRKKGSKNKKKPEPKTKDKPIKKNPLHIAHKQNGKGKR